VIAIKVIDSKLVSEKFQSAEFKIINYGDAKKTSYHRSTRIRSILSVLEPTWVPDPGANIRCITTISRTLKKYL